MTLAPKNEDSNIEIQDDSNSREIKHNPFPRVMMIPGSGILGAEFSYLSVLLSPLA
jgi:hypothetical protein